MKKTVTVIDTFAFFFRAYFALPPLKSKEGFPTGLLTGFINFIHQLQNAHMTDYIVFALDSKEEGFRKQLYPEYKANRPTPPEDLKLQLEIAISWIKKMGFKTLSKAGYEADDVMATLVTLAKKQGIVGKMVSSDKDLYQLLDDSRVFLYDWVKKKDIDESECVKKFGVFPKDFVDFQALIGDSSDNIPGVPGIGPKTASKLINEFHTLENIYENIEKAGTKRIQNLLLEHKEQAFLSRELVRLKTDIFSEDELDISAFEFKDINYLSLIADELEKYDMHTALKWAKGEKNGPKKPKKLKQKKENSFGFEAITIRNKKQLDEVVKECEGKVVAFDTETSSLDSKNTKLVGFSFAFDEQKAYYVPLAHSYLGVEEQLKLEDIKEAVRTIYKQKLVGQNLKFDFAVIKSNLELNPPIPEADTMILAWLLEPGSRVGLDNLAKKFLDYEMKSFKDTVKKGEDFSSVDISEATFYAAEDAIITLRLYEKLKALFENTGLEHLLKEAKEVEFPFILTLLYMEEQGIKADIKHLEYLKEKLTLELRELSLKIYKEAGEEFNIKSTKQLGEILFGKLGLKGAKKTKTGFSTNETVLKSLADEHPIIEHILEYRERQKMLSTYVEPLLKLAKKDKNSRIYTSFVQTGTATGRLASKEPNLQNIPVKSELGREVRRAFIAKEGYSLVSIDYSQIELRLLAHFSKDKALLEAFEKDKDIHLETAIKLFGEQEAKAKRNFAKSINFGLLYGMGSRKLAQELGISTKEAKEIIENYFAAFPTVKAYLEQIQEDVKRQGYVETLLKRRRVFDYENATPMAKAAILREAVNTVFQGSAADLIKLSMLEIHQFLEEEQLFSNANMLLQIHDELIFEIEQKRAKELSEKFASMMEHIYPLDVKLKCSISIAHSWDKLK